MPPAVPTEQTVEQPAKHVDQPDKPVDKPEIKKRGKTLVLKPKSLKRLKKYEKAVKEAFELFHPEIFQR